jgi:hypothetical protein
MPPISVPRKNRRKKSSSKKIFLNRHFLNSLKKGLILFSVVAISLVFLASLSFVRTVQKSHADASSSSSFDITNQDITSLLLVTVNTMNLASEKEIKPTNIDFVLFDKVMKKTVIFKLPLDLERDIPGRFGTEKYENVLQIGIHDGKSFESGVSMLKKLVMADFAFNVDRVLVVPESISEPVLNTFEQGRTSSLLNYSTLSDILLHSYTDITAKDAYETYTFLQSLTSDRFILHQESGEYYASSDFVDSIIRDITFDSNVAKEEKSFAIMNGTTIPGAANFGARMVTNMGGHVIAIENASVNYSETSLVASDLDSVGMKVLKRFFDVAKVTAKADYHGSENLTDRADVTLIIGFDIAESL